MDVIDGVVDDEEDDDVDIDVVDEKWDKAVFLDE